MSDKRFIGFSVLCAVLLYGQCSAENKIAQQIENDVASRAIALPSQMALDVEWYSPHINATEVGRIIKGWVREDLVLLETEKHILIAVRRDNGVERWRCQLDQALRYSPAISQNNVVVNVNNFLVAIERHVGGIRWKLLPNFPMSCEPLVIDPAEYPKKSTKQWQKMESIYVGSWDGRLHAMSVRGRMCDYVKGVLDSQNFSAPEFDLSYLWHKTHTLRGAPTTGIKVRDNVLYYATDDKNFRAVDRDGEEHEPYSLLGAPVTGITLTNDSIYVGARDTFVYCLDRLTLRKKWFFAPGFEAEGNIMADELATPLVYVATNNGMLNALRVQFSRPNKDLFDSSESFSKEWEVAGCAGVITAGPTIVYAGLNREEGFPGYKGIAAIDKATGKVLWKNEGGLFSDYVEFHNSWTKPNQAARVYAITADNRLVSLKEKLMDTGMKVVKPLEGDPKASSRKSRNPVP